jgi:hypothetical protein
VSVRLEGDARDADLQVQAYYSADPTALGEPSEEDNGNVEEEAEESEEDGDSESSDGADSDTESEYDADFFKDDDDRALLASMPDSHREAILTGRRERQEARNRKGKVRALMSSQSNDSDSEGGGRAKGKGKGKKGKGKKGKGKKRKTKKKRQRPTAAKRAAYMRGLFDPTAGVLCRNNNRKRPACYADLPDGVDPIEIKITRVEAPRQVAVFVCAIVH